MGETIPETPPGGAGRRRVASDLTPLRNRRLLVDGALNVGGTVGWLDMSQASISKQPRIL